MASVTMGRLGTVGTRSERSAAAPLKHIDVSLVVTTIALAGMGLVMVYSATRGTGEPDDPVDRTFLMRQGMFLGIGAVVMVITSVLDYRRWSRWAPFVYFATLMVLGLVLSPLGDESKGTQAWFQFGTFQLQPSELGKVGLIIALGAYVALRNDEMQFRHLVVAIIIAGIPMGLILLQPDLGTALVFMAITTGILLVGGARPRHIMLVSVVGLIAVFGILNSDVLAEYQKDRLTGFTNPAADVQGDTWNQNQSLIAIGAGGIEGQGLFNGQQTRSGRVPEQQTDFIFTVIAEELGFVGAAGLLVLFGFLMWRVWRIAHLSRDLFGTLLAVGVMTMFLFQLFQSVGMTVGIMPVTGIPLPLVSYGGSSTLATCVALGLVQSVHMHRFT